MHLQLIPHMREQLTINPLCFADTLEQESKLSVKTLNV